jgi:hypothetical protein
MELQIKNTLKIPVPPVQFWVSALAENKSFKRVSQHFG